MKHYRTHRENWEGGFSRNEEADAKALAENPLPSDELAVRHLKINGHEVTYQGKMNMAFRTDETSRLIAFNGVQCTALELDGVNYTFSDKPVDITYVPVDQQLKSYQLRVSGEGEIRLPLPSAAFKSATVMNGKSTVKHTLQNGTVVLLIDRGLSGKWLDINFK